jgi:peptidoglycan/LPS O-acetylase OafA/YrhL
MAAAGVVRQPRRLGYMPWLDGLRAFSVLAVMGEHENVLLRASWLRWLGVDGFVGVDVFFVISGFLITTLLLQELGRDGRIRFGGFYARRARRLLPALAILLGVVLVGGMVFEPAHRVHILNAVVVTALYAANWAQALGHTHLASLVHTWSLACEEQFYALWPALLVGAAAIGLRGRRLVAVLGVSTLASLVYPVIGAQARWSMFRLYYGLDTHAAGLLLGATLGAAWTSGCLPTGRTWRAVRRGVGVAGAIGLVALIESGETISRHLASVVPHLRVVHGPYFIVTDYLLASVAAAAVIWALVEEPPGPAHQALGWGPVRGLGRISYGLYLYSTPLTLLLTPSTTGIASVPLLVSLQVAAAIAAAWLSYWFVERRFLRRSVDPKALPEVMVVVPVAAPDPTAQPASAPT